MNLMRFGLLPLLVLGLSSSVAGAAPRTLQGAGFTPPGDVEPGLEREQEEPELAPRLVREWRFGAAVQAYTGAAAYRTASATWAHGVVGGTVRLRYGHLSLGGFYEVSDAIEQGEWQAAGAFAGAHFHFANWVDIDAGLGAAKRTHSEEDLRYGPNGYRVSTPTLCFRLQVSDRSADSTAALRLGAELFASFDLKRVSEPWSYELARVGDEPILLTGDTDVGGASVGLAFSIGFDLAEPASFAK